MFDKTQAANGKSKQSLGVSLAIHCVLAIALFATHFTVKSQIAPRRNTRVQLIAPTAPQVKKQVAVRMPARLAQNRALVKLPTQILPPLTAPPPPRLQASAILAEAPPMAQTIGAALPAESNPVLPVPVQTVG